MKQFQYKNYLFVEVPEGKQGYFIHDGSLWSDELYPGLFSVKLSGQYTILGKADELTEEQWRGMLKESGVNKIRKEDGGGYVTKSDFKTFGTAFLKWKSMKPETTLVLIEG